MSTALVAALSWNSRLSGTQRTIGIVIVGAEFAFFMWRDRAWYLELLSDLLASSSWMQGAEGERRVGVHLNSLSDDYVVFHDFRPTDSEGQLQPWNVDHIVVGPTGVFVIETKMYSRARVLPAEKEHATARNVRQVARNALELKDRLVLWSGGALSGTFVEAVLVYAQDNAFVEKLREGSTQVLPLQYLLKNIIGRRKHDLSQEQAYRVARALATRLSDRKRGESSNELDRLDSLYAGARTAAVKIDAAEAGPTGAQNDCPLCGAPLMRMVARKGSFKGRAFMGCSRWRLTGCAYKLNLEE